MRSGEQGRRRVLVRLQPLAISVIEKDGLEDRFREADENRLGRSCLVPRSHEQGRVSTDHRTDLGRGRLELVLLNELSELLLHCRKVDEVLVEFIRHPDPLEVLVSDAIPEPPAHLKQ